MAWMIDHLMQSLLLANDKYSYDICVHPPVSSW